MIEPFRVAAIQFEPLLGAKDRNIERLLELAETAAQGGARLIVLPEMATTGYCWYDRDEIGPYVEPIPGPTTTAFAELARQYGCYIVVGMPELVPGRRRRRVPQNPQLRRGCPLGEGRRPWFAGVGNAARHGRHLNLHGRRVL